MASHVDQDSTMQDVLLRESTPFFSQDIPRDVDLARFPFDESLFEGALSRVAERARGHLSDLNAWDIFNVLLMGDWLIARLIETKFRVTNQFDVAHVLSEELLGQISSAEFLPLVADYLDKIDIRIAGEPLGSPEFAVTPTRLFAACALAEVYRATAWIDEGDGVSEAAYHAMQASEAISMAQMVAGNAPFAVQSVIKASFVARARLGAAARLAKDTDGKQAAKSKAHKLWLDWQAGRTLHASAAAFHRHVCKELPAITSTKTVEHWCTQWSAEK
jgi:hypothetical protein